jgi:aminoglycoside phosphotransferase (APT) family kinase protein
MSELHETPELDRALPGIARVLAELHALRGIDLRAATYVEEVAASTTRDAARIGSLQPALAGRAKGIAQRLVRLERRIPAATRFPQVPIHGAFRLSQLLAQGERIALVDFDGVALGDPHYDVAELQASLVYRVFRGNLDRPAALRRGGAFLDAYEATGPCSPDERRLAWLRAAFVLEKLYLSLKNLELAILPQSEAILDFVESELDALEAA